MAAGLQSAMLEYRRQSAPRRDVSSACRRGWSTRSHAHQHAGGKTRNQRDLGIGHVAAVGIGAHYRRADRPRCVDRAVALHAQEREDGIERGHEVGVVADEVVTRERSRHDERVVLVALTTKGRKQLCALRSRVRANQVRTLGRLSPAERVTLTTQLHLLADVMVDDGIGDVAP